MNTLLLTVLAKEMPDEGMNWLGAFVLICIVALIAYGIWFIKYATKDWEGEETPEQRKEEDERITQIIMKELKDRNR